MKYLVTQVNGKKKLLAVTGYGSGKTLAFYTRDQVFYPITTSPSSPNATQVRFKVDGQIKALSTYPIMICPYTLQYMDDSGTWQGDSTIKGGRNVDFFKNNGVYLTECIPEETLCHSRIYKYSYDGINWSSFKVTNTVMSDSTWTKQKETFQAVASFEVGKKIRIIYQHIIQYKYNPTGERYYSSYVFYTDLNLPIDTDDISIGSDSTGMPVLTKHTITSFIKEKYVPHRVTPSRSMNAYSIEWFNSENEVRMASTYILKNSLNTGSIPGIGTSYIYDTEEVEDYIITGSNVTLGETYGYIFTGKKEVDHFTWKMVNGQRQEILNGPRYPSYGQLNYMEIFDSGMASNGINIDYYFNQSYIDQNTKPGGYNPLNRHYYLLFLGTSASGFVYNMYKSVDLYNWYRDENIPAFISPEANIVQRRMGCLFSLCQTY